MGVEDGSCGGASEQGRNIKWEDGRARVADYVVWVSKEGGGWWYGVDVEVDDGEQGCVREISRGWMYKQEGAGGVQEAAKRAAVRELVKHLKAQVAQCEAWLDR